MSRVVERLPCRRLLGLCLVWATAAPLAACSPLDDAMVLLFGRSMRDQNSLDPYERTLPPPEGSVPFSAGNLAAGPYQTNLGQPEGLPVGQMPPPFTAGDVARQADVVLSLQNPVRPTAGSLERGAELYNRFCAPCHSPTGVGAEAPLAEVHPTVSVFDLSGETVQGYTDGYIYGMIRVGRGLMPPYGHQIGHYDRWHVVNYVRRLQGLVPEGGVAEEDGAPAGEGGGGEG